MESEILISPSPPTSPLPASKSLAENLSHSLFDSVANEPDPEPETTADDLLPGNCSPLKRSYSSRGSCSSYSEPGSVDDDADKKPIVSSRPWSDDGDDNDSAANLSLHSAAPSLPLWLLEDEMPTSVGAGLSNLGNTCFLNSVLQCLTHTVGFVQALSLYSNHLPCERTNARFCMFCSLYEHVKLSLNSTGRVVSPYGFVNNLSYISSCFQRFQQEDAHEFLQCFLDRFGTSCNNLMTKGGGSLSQDDNLIKQVFGGRLVSKLCCCNCDHSSDTYEPSIDLSLEIEDVDNLLNALESFTRVEKIEDAETKFTCEKCKEEVSVEKQLMLEQSPVVSALHLKRFKNFGSFVEKIDKHVEFPLELDLGPYTSSSSQDNDLKYDLYAVIVHTAFTSTCGHYYCFIRSAPDTWYKFDDSKVIRVEEAYVLSQEAYILFYAKQGTPWFSSFMETYKPLLDTLSNASPKSVLDTVDISISPINVTSNHASDVSIVHTTSNHCTDANEITEATNEIPVLSFSQPRHAISESTEAKVGYNVRQAQLNPGTSKSIDGMYNNVEKVILRSVQSALSNTEMGKICNANVATKTPPRSPSPDVYKEEISPDIVFSTKCTKVESVDRMSCKRQLNNDSEDPQVKEARKQCKNMPGGRRVALLAAMGGSQSEGSVNKKSKKRMTSNPSRDYSYSSDRSKSNRHKFSRPLAATASSQ